MTETKTAISLMVEKGDKIEKGDLVTIEDAKGFIKDSTYEILEVSESSMILENESGSRIRFKIDDTRVYKVQNAF